MMFWLMLKMANTVRQMNWLNSQTIRALENARHENVVLRSRLDAAEAVCKKMVFGISKSGIRTGNVTVTGVRFICDAAEVHALWEKWTQEAKE